MSVTVGASALVGVGAPAPPVTTCIPAWGCQAPCEAQPQEMRQVAAAMALMVWPMDIQRIGLCAGGADTLLCRSARPRPNPKLAVLLNVGWIEQARHFGKLKRDQQEDSLNGLIAATRSVETSR